VFRSDSNSFSGESGSIAKRFTDSYQVIPISTEKYFWRESESKYFLGESGSLPNGPYMWKRLACGRFM
jgi:hypothetical protein